ncbi:EAL domain-containing protein [Paludisphaera mucosa]|uniref:EAL domain-containing protein n=1 Tax=Paludisphaera mucosa TaxID=3030827 RepID=A0ABT6FAG6_9BACT|nr:EAL domain-containing protein [Paludisphaera mucosa]MDG3004582.1 EAL domain-containing protein [Paludisphaera mucosa]
MEVDGPLTPTAKVERTPSREARCDCRSDRRTLALLAADLAAEYPELSTFRDVDWRVFPRLGAVRVELGAGRRLSGAGELVGFLRSVLDERRLGALRAAWVGRNRPLEDQLNLLLHAGPLLALAPADSSPLLEIFHAGRLETWFQPVVAAADGTVWGYECLMRGRTPQGELVPAGQMIAWSRQENLTFLLDRMCRETHLRNAAVHLAGSDVNLLINFLPTAIYDPVSCLATTVAVAKMGGIVPERIIFEVVETEKVADLNHLRSILDLYRRLGFRSALDDLGSGYSGLAMLADLDPDLIKIDRQLIAGAVKSPIHRGICAALARLGRDHGKLVLAEGVETVEEKAMLGDMGVDLFQGYLFGRPAPVPAVPSTW